MLQLNREYAFGSLEKCKAENDNKFRNIKVMSLPAEGGGADFITECQGLSGGDETHTVSANKGYKY